MLLMRRSVPIVLVLMVVHSAIAADVRSTESWRPDVIAETYEDGNILLVLAETDLESLPDLRMADLSGASPEQREAIMREFFAGKFDGVFLGAPTRRADPGPVKSSCDNLVDCAKNVKRVCKSVGSKAVSVSITNGCSGSCKDGMDVSVVCAN